MTYPNIFRTAPYSSSTHALKPNPLHHSSTYYLYIYIMNTSSQACLCTLLRDDFATLIIIIIIHIFFPRIYAFHFIFRFTNWKKKINKLPKSKFNYTYINYGEILKFNNRPLNCILRRSRPNNRSVSSYTFCVHVSNEHTNWHARRTHTYTCVYL